MSEKEVDRYKILCEVQEGRINQIEASNILRLTSRHVRNLLQRLSKEGKKGLISKQRGKPSNNQLSPELRKKILKHIRHYLPCGPTFAQEKLWEDYKLKVSVETVRKLMQENGFWFAKKKQAKKVHPRRERRSCFGELIQADASDHGWFEKRAPRCSLIGFIDDATSKFTSLQFCKSENLEGYFQTLNQHIEVHGVPRALYSDRHSVFKVTRQHLSDGEHITQFKRATNELGIELIYALSPQAKGRIERAFGTLQDRLVKELRLRQINTIEEANEFLKEYLPIYNKKFGKIPLSSVDAHRRLEKGKKLKYILCRVEERTLSKDLSFQYNNTIYQLDDTKDQNKMSGKKVKICEVSDTEIEVLYEGRVVSYSKYDERPAVSVVDNPEPKWEVKQKWIPPETHYYKRSYRHR